MLLEDIKNNWKTDILGYAQVISSLKDTGESHWILQNRFPRS